PTSDPESTAPHSTGDGPHRRARAAPTLGGSDRYERRCRGAPAASYRRLPDQARGSMTNLALLATGLVPKRRLIPSQLPPHRLLAESEAWIRAEYPDGVRTTAIGTAEKGVWELAVSLHPAASDVVISAAEGGEFGIRAWFPPVGPGYQTFVGRLAQRIGAEHA